MNCKRIQKKLPLIIGGELPEKKKQRIQHHIDRCKSCQNQLESLRISCNTFSKAFRNQQIPMTDKNFTNNVMRHIPEPQKIYTYKKRTAYIRLAWAFPAIAVAAVFFFFLIRGDLFKEKSSKETFTSHRALPLVEKTEPGVTVMTFQTDDPKVTIVWFFQNDNLKDKENNHAM